MADIYHEQLVRRKAGMKEGAIRAAAVAGVMFVTYMAFTIIPSIAIFIFAALCFGCWYLFSFQSVEYEYSFTSGELDVDVVYARRRRKRVVSVDIRGADSIRRLREGERVPTAEQTHDFTAHTGERPFVLTANIKSKRTVILFDPNEAMLNAMAPFAGRKLER